MVRFFCAVSAVTVGFVIDTVFTRLCDRCPSSILERQALSIKASPRCPSSIHALVESDAWLYGTVYLRSCEYHKAHKVLCVHLFFTHPSMLKHTPSPFQSIIFFFLRISLQWFPHVERSVFWGRDAARRNRCYWGCVGICGVEAVPLNQRGAQLFAGAGYICFACV